MSQKPKKKTSRKMSKADEATLRRIPKQVEVFLKDLQVQMQSGAIDLTDWRSLGIGILNRISQVSATLRSATGTASAAVSTKPMKRARSVTAKAKGVKKVVKKSVAKSKVKKAKKH